MFKLRFMLVGALSLLLLVVVLQNAEVVTVTFLFWHFEMSRVILILLATMIGFVSGYVVARLTGRHRVGQGVPASGSS